jgi:hypothetical protein
VRRARRIRGAALLGSALLAGGLLASGVAAPAPLSLHADARETGWVRAVAVGAPGTVVRILERRGTARHEVGRLRLDGGNSGRVRVVRWRCDRRERRLAAIASGPDGTVQSAEAVVRTPSCRHRLAASVRPARPRAGGAFAVEILDSWRLGGIRAAVCVRPRRGAGRCRRVALAPGRTRLAVRWRAPRPGRWTVEVRSRWRQRLRRSLPVRPRAGALRVLATGDSMIQILDFKLADRLRPLGATLRSDARIATGISKPFQLDWVGLAGRQAHGLRPDVTVMFIGPNDGFPIGGHACCGSAWRAGYAARARRMMALYARGGAAQVYWLLLPAARERRFQRVFVAVNAALRRAARGLGPAVRLIDLGRIFTPGGRFRARMRVGSRRLTVRQGDGVHLSVAGAALAASIVVRAMRADGVIAAGRAKRSARARKRA